MATPIQPLASRGALIEALAAPGASVVVLDLHRKWCGPCTSLEPTFKKIFDELADLRKAAEGEAASHAAAAERAEEAGGATPTAGAPALDPSLVPNALQIVAAPVC
jgi:hypothetical protein